MTNPDNPNPFAVGDYLPTPDLPPAEPSLERVADKFLVANPLPPVTAELTAGASSEEMDAALSGRWQSLNKYWGKTKGVVRSVRDKLAIEVDGYQFTPAENLRTRLYAASMLPLANQAADRANGVDNPWYAYNPAARKALDQQSSSTAEEYSFADKARVAAYEVLSAAPVRLVGVLALRATTRSLLGPEADESPLNPFAPDQAELASREAASTERAGKEARHPLVYKVNRWSEGRANKYERGVHNPVVRRKQQIMARTPRVV